MLNSKISKFATITVFIISLVGINVFVNTKSMEMSQKALELESAIKKLDQENALLASQLAKMSSYKYISEVAESSGYTQDLRFIRMPAPVFAKR